MSVAVHPPAAGSRELLSASEIFSGRNVFILGSTGFLGKVLLSMLLHRFPEVRRVYVMVRSGSGTDSESRFWKSVVGSPTFNPLRERLGGPEALKEFLREKVRVVDGDISVPDCGIANAQAVADDIDVIINSSGRVTFDPPLEMALKTNVEGTKNVIAFARRMKRPALVHTSTCFVAGNRAGEVWEDEEVLGYFPRKKEMAGTVFDVERELADCQKVFARIREQADDAQVLAELRKKARSRLREENRDPDDEGSLKLAVARERKEWMRREFVSYGTERAKGWGWPNIYCYTKSMGDQLIAQATDMVRSIVRPAIVESALAYPFPGWNEGFTTSAPLVYLALKGQYALPVDPKLMLDVIPVDMVAAATLLVSAQACVEQPKLVHQLATGDVNGCTIDRLATLTGLYKRKRFQEKDDGRDLVNEIAARMEFKAVSFDTYERVSLPMINKVAKKVGEALDRARPRWAGGRFTQMVDSAKKKIDDVVRVTDEANRDIVLFRPFIEYNSYVLRCDNTRAVRDRFRPDDREALAWAPEKIDWYDYWLNVHCPGLAKWVLPELDQTYASKPKQVYAYHDLLEMFDTTCKLHGTRVAMRMERGKREEVYSYGDLQELASRAGAFLVGQGIKANDRVMLFGKNAPEWGMSYFGILKTGATAVPVAHESTVPELVNVARASGATGIMLSDELLEKRSRLPAALKEAGLSVALWPMSQVFEIGDEATENERKKALLRKQSPDAVASIIFTSGTTGKPKGVMLTHRNFTFMVSELCRVFELGVNDGFLSLLPLHHTFEFSTSLLVALSRGTQITYLQELTGESISDVLKKGHVTAIVGVPALWDMMRRRVLQKFADKSALLEGAVKALTSLNYELRGRTGIDLGVLMFVPVHQGFGGRIRYLVSGGSALAPDVLKTFYGMGFDFFEGYGLTETSPVLAVTSPKEKPIAGSVGQPLQGVEVKLENPDASGVGEIIARGRNVMAGYFGDEEATAAALRDGWFHTGDLGRFDEDGNLYVVGRSKDIIVDASGKNIYPDEIEELYRGSPYIKELTVVGIPEGSAEYVACAVRPDNEYDKDMPPEAVRARIEEHFRKISADLPFWKRVKTLEFWDEGLPRTSTGLKKVKRREVVAEILKRLRREDEKAGQMTAQTRSDERERVVWLLDIIAEVTGRDREEIHLHSRLDHLGFDSLMWTELGAALEAKGVNAPEADFSGVVDVAELYQVLTHGRGVSSDLEKKGKGSKHWYEDDRGDIRIPSAVGKLGKSWLAMGQAAFYRHVMDSKIQGDNNIPLHTNFIVAANHTSHLDMGLVKVALGEAGQDLASLAAADYFFRNKWRRAYFSNFTNLVPIDRSGHIRKTMDVAEGILRGGRSLLVFPEGSRSRTGEMSEFLPSLGYVALRAERGILPAFVSGTFEALPKGKSVPRKRKVGVAFGPFLSYESLQKLVHGLPQQEGWRLVSVLVQRVVENLRDGVPNQLDLKEVRAAWDGTGLAPGAEQRRVRQLAEAEEASVETAVMKENES